VCWYKSFKEVFHKCSLKTNANKKMSKKPLKCAQKKRCRKTSFKIVPKCAEKKMSKQVSKEFLKCAQIKTSG
jgi:hypothetical protein